MSYHQFVTIVNKVCYGFQHILATYGPYIGVILY